MQLSPARLKGTLSPQRATTAHATAQNTSWQEMQSNTAFCFEADVDLHTSAPRSLAQYPPKAAAEGCPGPQHRAGLHTRQQALTLGGAAGRRLPGSSAKRRKSEQISSLPAPTLAQRLQDRRPNHEDYSVYIRAKDK